MQSCDRLSGLTELFLSLYTTLFLLWPTGDCVNYHPGYVCAVGAGAQLSTVPAAAACTAALGAAPQACSTHPRSGEQPLSAACPFSLMRQCEAYLVCEV